MWLLRNYANNLPVIYIDINTGYSFNFTSIKITGKRSYLEGNLVIVNPVDALELGTWNSLGEISGISDHISKTALDTGKKLIKK